MRLNLTCIAAICALLALNLAESHEIPTDIVVRAYLKPEPYKLNLLVRVPLEAMRDIQFPQRGLGYLDIAAADRTLRDAAQIWIANDIHLYEGKQRLSDKRVVAVRVALPSDTAFRSYEQAYQSATGPPLPEDTQLFWTQAVLDVLIEAPIKSADSTFAIEPELARLGIQTVTVLQFLPPGGGIRAFEFSGNPGLVQLDPRWHQAFGRFVNLGIHHILQGYDHLLFVMCLIIPFRRVRPLIVLVTSFTVAHSITLLSAAFGFAPGSLWFPPFIEMLIAVSIVYMALENIVGTRWQRRWMIAFAFGLVHGFGFSFALSETLQFAGSHLLTSLLAFNLGVELGQILVILLVVPVLNVLFRTARAERVGTIILSALLAHSGWHWMSDRASVLLQYPLRWPVFDPSLLATLMRWMLLIAVIGGAGWATFRAYQRFLSPRRSDGSSTEVAAK
ncbi:MAG: HupE/UreJ family protein [Woeseia sp.]